MRNWTRVATWHAAPDRDRRDVEHQAAEVEERPGADRDPRAVLEVERRPDVDALADVPEQLEQERVALVLLRRGRCG